MLFLNVPFNLNSCKTEISSNKKIFHTKFLAEWTTFKCNYNNFVCPFGNDHNSYHFLEKLLKAIDCTWNERCELNRISTNQKRKESEEAIDKCKSDQKNVFRWNRLFLFKIVTFQSHLLQLESVRPPATRFENDLHLDTDKLTILFYGLMFCKWLFSSLLKVKCILFNRAIGRDGNG